MKPLTVGNVVSAGLRIYRDRFVDYYKLAFIGYLWVLVPIYGWAKYSAMMGLISRLAFGEVTEKPESIRDAERFIKPKKWSFLGAGILVGIRIMLALIGLSIAFGIVFGIFSSILSQNSSAISVFVGGLVILAGFLGLLFALTWLASRFLIAEVPLAMEENLNASDAVDRSWKLTEGSIFRLQMVLLVSFLISVPISIAIQIASVIIQLILGTVASTNPELFDLLLIIFTMLLSIAGGSLLIPFWQSIKAVIYYDLRVRREGFGLDLEKN